MLVDVSIDQGGCFETSHATTHDAPTYEVDGIIHYCVANMPGAVPATSSHALNHATLPFGLALANHGERRCVDDVHLRHGLNIHRGKRDLRAGGAGARPARSQRRSSARDVGRFAAAPVFDSVGCLARAEPAGHGAHRCPAV